MSSTSSESKPDSAAPAAPGALFSETTIEFAANGPMAFVERTATISGLAEPLVFGVREPWNAIYHTQPGQFPVRPTTNDVFIASVGACMAGTFGGILEARGITLTAQNCSVSIRGEIGAPDHGSGSHIVRSIHIAFAVSGVEDPALRAKISRVHDLVHGECWLSQTLAGSRCEITSSVDFLED